MEGRLLPLVLSVEFRAVCGRGVRLHSGRSFRRGGGCREAVGVVRALGGEPNGVDDVGEVGDSVQRVRDRVRRGGARARGTREGRPVLIGEYCWRYNSTYVGGTVIVDRERGINGVGTGGAYPTAAWSANGDICASSRTADRLVGSSPTATVCVWVYVVDPTDGPPLMVGGGAKYVTGVRLASSIASSSARARACHSYVELRSDRKLWRLLAEKGSPVDCTAYRSSSLELTDCNSFCFFICLRCLRMRIKRPPRARLATTPAMMTPAAALGCERNLERSLRSIPAQELL